MKYYEKEKINTLPVQQAVGKMLHHDITQIIPLENQMVLKTEELHIFEDLKLLIPPRMEPGSRASKLKKAHSPFSTQSGKRHRCV